MLVTIFTKLTTKFYNSVVSGVHESVVRDTFWTLVKRPHSSAALVSNSSIQLCRDGLSVLRLDKYHLIFKSARFLLTVVSMDGWFVGGGPLSPMGFALMTEQRDLSICDIVALPGRVCTATQFHLFPWVLHGLSNGCSGFCTFLLFVPLL